MARVLRMGDPRQNLELKARDLDPARSLGTCESLGAEDLGMLFQRDTYFKVQQGRLKLREEPGVEAHLIAYERPDLPDQKESRYRIVPTRYPDELRDALSTALGIWIVVSKARRLFILDGIRIHLDRLTSLGTSSSSRGWSPTRAILDATKVGGVGCDWPSVSAMRIFYV
jgi:adenylate cyclase, class 2